MTQLAGLIKVSKSDKEKLNLDTHTALYFPFSPNNAMCVCVAGQVARLLFLSLNISWRCFYAQL